MTTTDVAVIGRGLIGAAAARHLGESGVDCMVIGRAEPDSSSEVEGRAAWAGPFSSHFDEGRITRITADSLLWSQLAARSIRRYADIEARSGIAFHGRSGLIVALDDLDRWIDNGLITGSDIRKVDADWVRGATGIELPGGASIGYEGPPAGYVNPRRLIAAQTALAEAAGVKVIDDVVTKLTKVATGFDVSGQWGALTARRVLIATGAFGGSLIGTELDVVRRPRTVVLAEPAGAPTGVTIPSLILRPPPDERLATIYWVPPVDYPDGRRCIKIGGTLHEERLVEEGTDLTEWFSTAGYEPEIDALKATVQALLPKLPFASFTSRPCVITETPSGHPYVGFVDDGVAVAVGGNGSAAKSSDELGRLASMLFSEEGWSDSIDAELLAPQIRATAG